MFTEVLTAATSDQQSSTVQWYGGPGVLSAQGTWSGARVKVQKTLDGSTWIDVPETTLRSNGDAAFSLPVCQVRVDMALGTSGTTAVTAWLQS